MYSETLSQLPTNWKASTTDNTIFCAGVWGVLRPLTIGSEEFEQYLQEEADERTIESEDWEGIEAMIPTPQEIQALCTQLFPTS